MATYMTDDLVPRWSTFTTDDNLNPDTFIVFQDVDKIHNDMIEQYYILKEKQYTTDSEKVQMTQLEVNLQEYLPTSDTWNKLCACIRGMQMYMRDGIVVFVEQKQAEINKIISNYSEKGDWNATTNYSTGNFVRHGEFLFLSKIDNNLNHEPNNEVSSDTYWLRFMIKGEKGDPSLNISIKKGTDGTANYDNTITYNVGEACVYNHRLYYCIVDGTVGINPSDITHWKCADKIWVGTDIPLDTSVIWWDTNVGENIFKRYSDNNEWVRQNVKGLDVTLLDSSNYFNSKNVESALQQVGSSTIYQTASGSANAITLVLPTLVNGYSTTFIANGNNNGNATTINAKPLYKPNTTIAPNLILGKAYTIWYNLLSNCFFIKASAEGNTITTHVLAGDKFSNDTDTGLIGTMPENGSPNVTLNAGQNYNLAQGHYNGGTITANNLASQTPSNINNSNQIVSGYYAICNGSRVDGNATLQSLGGSRISTNSITVGSSVIGTWIYNGYVAKTYIGFRPSKVILYNSNQSIESTKITTIFYNNNIQSINYFSKYGSTPECMQGTLQPNSEGTGIQIDSQYLYIFDNDLYKMSGYTYTYICIE